MVRGLWNRSLNVSQRWIIWSNFQRMFMISPHISTFHTLTQSCRKRQAKHRELPREARQPVWAAIRGKPSIVSCRERPADRTMKGSLKQCAHEMTRYIALRLFIRIKPRTLRTKDLHICIWTNCLPRPKIKSKEIKKRFWTTVANNHCDYRPILAMACYWKSFSNIHCLKLWTSHDDWQ